MTQDSPIRTVEDLRGKKVAYSRATNAQWLVVSALRSKGLTLKDIESTFLPPGALRLVIGQRHIDHGDTGFPIALQFLATDDAIKNKKAAVAAYVRQLEKHLAWAHAHPKQRAQAIAGILRLDPAVVLVAEQRRPAGLRAIDDVIVKGNQDIADTFLAEGVIPRKLDVSTTFTTEFNKDSAP